MWADSKVALSVHLAESWAVHLVDQTVDKKAARLADSMAELLAVQTVACLVVQKAVPMADP
jgi:hypothetical protein